MNALLLHLRLGNTASNGDAMTEILFTTRVNVRLTSTKSFVKEWVHRGALIQIAESSRLYQRQVLQLRDIPGKTISAFDGGIVHSTVRRLNIIALFILSYSQGAQSKSEVRVQASDRYLIDIARRQSYPTRYTQLDGVWRQNLEGNSAVDDQRDMK